MNAMARENTRSLKLWITSWPNGKAVIVEIIEERNDKPGYYYIRKPGGGTETTTSKLLFDVPTQVTGINGEKYTQ